MPVESSVVFVERVEPSAPRFSEQHDDCVYSNFEQEFDAEMLARLEAAAPGTVFSHAAWEYNGKVWKTESNLYREQVWRYGMLVAEYESNDLPTLVERVIAEHGDG